MLPATTCRFARPRCDSQLETHGDPGDRTVRCPTCGGLLRIPATLGRGGSLAVGLGIAGRVRSGSLRSGGPAFAGLLLGLLSLIAAAAVALT